MVKLFKTVRDYEYKYGKEENQVISIPKDSYCNIYPASMTDDWKTLYGCFDDPYELEDYLKEYLHYHFYDSNGDVIYCNCVHPYELPEFIMEYGLAVVEEEFDPFMSKKETDDSDEAQNI